MNVVQTCCRQLDSDDCACRCSRLIVVNKNKYSQSLQSAVFKEWYGEIIFRQSFSTPNQSNEFETTKMFVEGIPPLSLEIA